MALGVDGEGEGWWYIGVCGAWLWWRGGTGKRGGGASSVSASGAPN